MEDSLGLLITVFCYYFRVNQYLGDQSEVPIEVEALTTNSTILEIQEEEPST